MVNNWIILKLHHLLIVLIGIDWYWLNAICLIINIDDFLITFTRQCHRLCNQLWKLDSIWKETSADIHRGGGYSVQKTLQGCAANMGSKISLLVYEWPLIKCKIRCMNRSIFQNFPKFEPKLKKKKKKKKSGDFAQHLAQNWFDWYMNGSLFLEKLVFVWVYFQIPLRHIPTKTKLEYPPRGHTFITFRLYLSSFCVFCFHSSKTLKAVE